MKQQDALNALKQGYNIYLTGPAGSGKTYLLNKYIAWLKKNGRRVAVTASTGIAATHLNGVTIHSWSGLGIKRELHSKDRKMIRRQRQLINRIEKTDVLIIDEISMLHDYQLDLVDEICRFVRHTDAPFGDLQIVLCGDFFQLPPVSRQTEKPSQFAYLAKAWQIADIRVCYLDEQHRHEDDALVALLNGIRAAAVPPASINQLSARLNQQILGERPTRLYTHNRDVDQENDRELKLIKSKSYRYTMQAQGNRKLAEALADGCLAPVELDLKVGASVMFVKNNFEAGYVNGTTGRIIDFNSETKLPLVLTNDNMIITAGAETWVIADGDEVLASIRQIPLRLAWAITVHKSQGMSLDAAEIDLSRAFEFGMGYVALSRVRRLTGLFLLGLNDRALQISPAILAFDQELRDASRRFEAEIAQKKAKKAKPAKS